MRDQQPARTVAFAAGKLDYKASGVDIDAGNELVSRIKKLNPEIGGFGGLFPFGMPPTLFPGFFSSPCLPSHRLLAPCVCGISCYSWNVLLGRGTTQPPTAPESVSGGSHGGLRLPRCQPRPLP